MLESLKQAATSAHESRLEKNGQALPPVHLWTPPFCGDINIRIARNGSWYHEGTQIHRQPLIRLLSTLLKREGDEYFLVTPTEKVRIQVEDVPFLAVAADEKTDSQPHRLLFRTLTDDVVPLDTEHPLRVVTDIISGEPRPYIMVRGNMEARIHRPVFYNLVEQGREMLINGKAHWVLDSAGEIFSLGCL